MKFKVKECKEFSCPFYHAGIMGQLECIAVRKDLSDEKSDGTFPDWCPLREEGIRVSK